MPNEGAAPARPWREIAADLAREMEPDKVTALIMELERALERQGRATRSEAPKVLAPARTTSPKRG